MVRLSMNEMTTLRWTFDEDVREYISAGYDGISVWRHKLSDFGEERGIELLDESDIAVSCLMWAGGFTGSEGRSYQESIDDGLEALRLAATMKAPSLIVYSGSRGGHTDNHVKRLVRDALSEMAALAQQLGVDVAVEPMHPGCAAEWTFLTSLNEVSDLLSDFENERLKLVCDVYHLVASLADIEMILQFVSKIAIVQLGDSRVPPSGEPNRCLLGEGNRPLAETISALIDAGYSGFFDVELMGEDIESLEYRHVLTHSRRAFDEMKGVRSG